MSLHWLKPEGSTWALVFFEGVCILLCDWDELLNLPSQNSPPCDVNVGGWIWRLDPLIPLNKLPWECWREHWAYHPHSVSFTSPWLSWHMPRKPKIFLLQGDCALCWALPNFSHLCNGNKEAALKISWEESTALSNGALGFTAPGKINAV